METKLKYYSRIKQRRRIVAQAFFKIRGIIIRSMNETRGKFYRKRKRSWNRCFPEFFDGRKKGRKKKKTVRSSDSSWIFQVIEYRCEERPSSRTRERREEFFKPIFFFPLLNRQNAFPHFPCSQRDYLSLPLPRFFLFLFFSSR